MTLFGYVEINIYSVIEGDGDSIFPFITRKLMTRRLSEHGQLIDLRMTEIPADTDMLRIEVIEGTEEIEEDGE